MAVGLERYFTDTVRHERIDWRHFADRLKNYHSPEYQIFSDNRFRRGDGRSPEVHVWNGGGASLAEASS